MDRNADSMALANSGGSFSKGSFFSKASSNFFAASARMWPTKALLLFSFMHAVSEYEGSSSEMRSADAAKVSKTYCSAAGGGGSRELRE